MFGIINIYFVHLLSRAHSFKKIIHKVYFVTVCNSCVTHSFSMFVFNTANKHSISVLRQNSSSHSRWTSVCISINIWQKEFSSEITVKLTETCQHVNMSCPQAFYMFKYHVRKTPKMKSHCNSNSLIACCPVPVNKTGITCLNYSLLKYIYSLGTSHITHSGWPLPGSGRKWVSPIHCSV